MPKPNLVLIEQVRQLATPEISSTEIAEILGRNPRHIRKILLKYDMPRPREGARRGEKNHQFAGGRRITLSGYALVTPPEGYPTAKPRPGRYAGYIGEHRYVMEQKLGRYLLPDERVDHIDGLTLHNHPDNLRVFATNAEHLRETLQGRVPNWSEEGWANMQRRFDLLGIERQVNIHQKRTEAGATRLRQILLAWLKLGKDSPYLSGTLQWLDKAGIDPSSRSNLERALDDLCIEWGWDQTL